MRGLKKSKRVCWASDVNLCQVKLANFSKKFINFNKKMYFVEFVDLAWKLESWWIPTSCSWRRIYPCYFTGRKCVCDCHLLRFSVVCACITYSDSACVIGFCNRTFDGIFVLQEANTSAWFALHLIWNEDCCVRKSSSDRVVFF